MEKSKAENVSTTTSYSPKDTQTLASKGRRHFQVTLAFYLLVPHPGLLLCIILVSSFLFPWLSWGFPGIPSGVCKNTHWEWRLFEDLAHIE
jgi:hypothetical protein